MKLHNVENDRFRCSFGSETLVDTSASRIGCTPTNHIHRAFQRLPLFLLVIIAAVRDSARRYRIDNSGWWMEKNRDRPTNIPRWTSIDDTNADTSMEICIFARREREREREREYVKNIRKRERQRKGKNYMEIYLFSLVRSFRSWLDDQDPTNFGFRYRDSKFGVSRLEYGGCISFSLRY